MISKIERVIAFRYLKPKKKEGFLKVISIFSFMGIALGVAILIIVMSVMDGFRTELVNKILGFNPHIIVKPYEKKIDKNELNKLEKLRDKIKRVDFSFNGQAILISKGNTSGILVRSYFQDDINRIDLIKDGIIDGSLDLFKKESDSFLLLQSIVVDTDILTEDERFLSDTVLIRYVQMVLLAGMSMFGGVLVDCLNMFEDNNEFSCNNYKPLSRRPSVDKFAYKENIIAVTVKPTPISTPSIA